MHRNCADAERAAIIQKGIAARATLSCFNQTAATIPDKKTKKFIVTLKPVPKAAGQDKTSSECQCEKSTNEPGRTPLKAEDELRGKATILNAFRLLAHSKFITIDQNVSHSGKINLQPPFNLTRLSGGSDNLAKQKEAKKLKAEAKKQENKKKEVKLNESTQKEAQTKETQEKKQKNIQTDIIIAESAGTSSSTKKTQKTFWGRRRSSTKEKASKKEELASKEEKPYPVEEITPAPQEPMPPEETASEAGTKEKYVTEICKPRELKKHSEVIKNDGQNDLNVRCNNSQRECPRIMHLEHQVEAMRKELSRIKREFIPQEDIMRYSALATRLQELNTMLAEMKHSCANGIEANMSTVTSPSNYNDERVQKVQRYICKPEPQSDKSVPAQKQKTCVACAAVAKATDEQFVRIIPTKMDQPTEPETHAETKPPKSFCSSGAQADSKPLKSFCSSGAQADSKPLKSFCSSGAPAETQKPKSICSSGAQAGKQPPKSHCTSGAQVETQPPKTFCTHTEPKPPKSFCTSGTQPEKEPPKYYCNSGTQPEMEPPKYYCNSGTQPDTKSTTDSSVQVRPSPETQPRRAMSHDRDSQTSATNLRASKSKPAAEAEATAPSHAKRSSIYDHFPERNNKMRQSLVEEILPTPHRGSSVPRSAAGETTKSTYGRRNSLHEKHPERIQPTYTDKRPSWLEQKEMPSWLEKSQPLPKETSANKVKRPHKEHHPKKSGSSSSIQERHEKPADQNTSRKSNDHPETNSFCVYCEGVEVPVVDSDLQVEARKIIQQRNPCDVALTIVLQADNLYHINIAVMKTGESLGCLFATENGINCANKEHVFEEFLTFFVVDANNTMEQKNKILGHTFEFCNN